MQNAYNLEEMLEKIVFDKDNLNNLKSALNKIRNGELSVSELGKIIVELRSRILERLIEFIPFHLKQAQTYNVLTEFTEDHSNTSQLEHELEERNQLLETVGRRINRIYEKLRNSPETSK